MNVPRRINALKREIAYREQELARVARMQAAGEPTFLAFPKFMKKYVRDLERDIGSLRGEIKDLQRFPNLPKFVKILRFVRRHWRKLM